MLSPTLAAPPQPRLQPRGALSTGSNCRDVRFAVALLLMQAANTRSRTGRRHTTNQNQAHVRVCDTRTSLRPYVRVPQGTPGRCPCRTTIFSNYAEKNCPPADALLPTLCMGDQSAPASDEARPGPWWSLMFEVSESQYKPVEWQEAVEVGGRSVPKIVAATIEGAINTRLIQPSDEIVSIYHRRCGALGCVRPVGVMSHPRGTAPTGVPRRGVTSCTGGRLQCMTASRMWFIVRSWVVALLTRLMAGFHCWDGGRLLCTSIAF